MSRYPRKPLEDKLAWMRDRQKVRARREAVAQPEPIPVKAAPKPAPERLPEHRQMLRVEQVARMLGMSARTVRRWFADRAVIVHPGPTKTTMLISQKALDDWFAEHEAKPTSSR